MSARDWEPPKLESKRLILRPFRANDGDAVFAICSNSHMTDYTLWETHETFHDTYYFIHDYARAGYLAEAPDPMAVIYKDPKGDTLVGSVGCFWVSRPDGVMELGFFTGRTFQNQGFATEASGLLLDYVWQNYDLNRLQARVMNGNGPSQKVLEKLGFQFEGLLRQMLIKRGKAMDIRMYSMLHGEWKSNYIQT